MGRANLRCALRVIHNLFTPKSQLAAQASSPKCLRGGKQLQDSMVTMSLTGVD